MLERLERFSILLSGSLFFLVQNRAVLRRATLTARAGAKTAAIEFTVFEPELEIDVLCRIAKNVDRVLPCLNFFQLFLELMTIENDAFVGESQRFLRAVRHSALGNPCDHVLAAVVIEQRPLRFAGRIDA